MQPGIGNKVFFKNMEEFESLHSIVEEFGIKVVSLSMFDLGQFIGCEYVQLDEVPVGFGNMGQMPVLTDAQGNVIEGLNSKQGIDEDMHCESTNASEMAPMGVASVSTDPFSNLEIITSSNDGEPIPSSPPQIISSVNNQLSSQFIDFSSDKLNSFYAMNSEPFDL